MKVNYTRKLKILTFTSLMNFLIVLFLFSSCEKISPVEEILQTDSLEFTCEICHTSEALLRLLAPAESSGGGSGGG